MYCPNCGRAVGDGENYCTSCGTRLCREYVKDERTELACLIGGILLPILGFVLYCVYEKTHPRRASASLKGALIGMGVRVFLNVIVRPLCFFIKLSIFGISCSL